MKIVTFQSSMIVCLPLTLLAAFFQVDAELTDQQSIGDGELGGHVSPAYAWEFNAASNTEGWGTNWAISGLTTQADVDGVYGVITSSDITQSDPQLKYNASTSNPTIQLPTGFSTWESMKARFRQLDDNPPAGQALAYDSSSTYIRAAGVNTFAQSFFGVTTEAGNWHTTSLSLSSSVDDFTSLRFDPVDGVSKNFEVDWVRLYALDQRSVHVGWDQSASAYVIPIQIPNIPVGEMVVGATLMLNLEGWSNVLSELGNVDLYGIGMVGSSNDARYSGFYVDGANPTNPDAYLLQDDLVTPTDISGASGSGQTISITSADIGAFIQDLLDAGAQPGEYAFFTLANDTTPSAPAYYAFTAADAPSGPKPSIEVTTSPVFSHPVYVDINAAPGGDGSANTPFNDIQIALDNCTGGETVVLAEGDYGPVFFDQRVDQTLFSELVVLQPHPSVSDPHTNVSIENFIIRDKYPTGLYDINLRIEGIRIRDGVIIEQGRLLEIVNCRLEKAPPWNGTGSNISKKAVELFNVDGITIRNCDVTNTAYGFVIKGSNIQILNNHIHHIAHDGIFGTALRDCLIEGNEIHNLDDGVDDGDPAGDGWNRHCDGIHLYTSGSGGGTWNERVTLRNNLIYDCESQGLIINNTGYNFTHKDITIENNIFGPTRALPINITTAENLIYRNNALISVPGGSTFTSIYGREINCSHNGFRIPDDPIGAQIYNNFFPRSFPKRAAAWIDYNAYSARDQADDALARFESIADPEFVNAGALDGELQATSPLINSGTRANAPTPIYPDDIVGTIRDNRPDIGPWEYPGLTPPAEDSAPAFVGPALYFVDDFADANFFRDPWLNGQNQQGIEWVVPEGGSNWSLKYYSGKNGITMSNPGDPQFLFTSEGDSWTDYSLTADAMPAGGPDSFGFLVRGNLDTEGYLVDINTGSIIIRQDSGGTIVETTLGTPVGSLMPSNKDKEQFQVTVEDLADGVQVTLRDDLGAIVIQETDASSTFSSGRAALMAKTGSASYKRTYFFDVAIDTDI